MAKSVAIFAGENVFTGIVKTRTTHDHWHGASTETVALIDGATAAYLDADGKWYADAALAGEPGVEMDTEVTVIDVV